MCLISCCAIFLCFPSLYNSSLRFKFICLSSPYSTSVSSWLVSLTNAFTFFTQLSIMLELIYVVRWPPWPWVGGACCYNIIHLVYCFISCQKTIFRACISIVVLIFGSFCRFCSSIHCKCWNWMVEVIVIGFWTVYLVGICWLYGMFLYVTVLCLCLFLILILFLVWYRLL